MKLSKRLMGTLGESREYIAINVLAQWISLIGNLVLATVLTVFLAELYEGKAGIHAFVQTAVISGAVLLVRLGCTILSAKMSFLSVQSVKRSLRERIYTKLLRLGAAYKDRVPTGEIVQVAVEGVDQLENYFGSLLPMLFYGGIATLTLFAYLLTIHFVTAACLLFGVALIPVAIAGAQTLAKHLYGKYWGQYTDLGNTFLENLQGLTTLKIYQADQFKHEEMNRETEKLRRISMKVLFMQLDSLTVMDFIACGGTAVGAILAVTGFASGKVSLDGCLHILVLAAEFFLPMRKMGESFHIAMKGRSAGEKIYKLLDLPEQARKGEEFPEDCTLKCNDLHFSYDGQREILRGVHMMFPMRSFTAIVGESGCGKSTVASILMDRHQGYKGNVTVGDVPIEKIAEESLLRNITYVSHQSYLFQGTVEENLRMGKPSATEEELWQVLERVHLADTLRQKQGLATPVSERNVHLSAGQCQRICLARAILHNSPIYIFDEATSNMDAESEHHIVNEISALAQEKTVILISHRLPNVMGADRIYVMEKGRVVEEGTHEALIELNGVYGKLWHVQHRVETHPEGGERA